MRGKITKEQAVAAKRHVEKLLDRAMRDHEYFLTQYTADMKQDAVYVAVGVKLS